MNLNPWCQYSWPTLFSPAFSTACTENRLARKSRFWQNDIAINGVGPLMIFCELNWKKIKRCFSNQLVAITKNIKKCFFNILVTTDTVKLKLPSRYVSDKCLWEPFCVKETSNFLFFYFLRFYKVLNHSYVFLLIPLKFF